MPSMFPFELYNEFTLDGKIPLFNLYFNEVRDASDPIVFSKEAYEVVFKQIQDNTFRYYDSTLDYINEALNDYDLAGKDVLVFGAQEINCDAIALSRGASKVYILEYAPIQSEHEQVICMTYDDYVQQGIQCDFAFSISSFEHDGLGRYGDPIRPDGDLQAMQFAKKLLKKDGILFLSVPIGADALVWNAHRIYGQVRLPLLLNNWEPVASYGLEEEDLASIKMLLEYNTPDWSNQPVIVLKNI